MFWYKLRQQDGICQRSIRRELAATIAQPLRAGLPANCLRHLIWQGLILPPRAGPLSLRFRFVNPLALLDFDIVDSLIFEFHEVAYASTSMLPFLGGNQ